MVFLALSIFAYMQAQKMVGKIMTDALGPGFWPKVLGLMMGVLSLALIVEGLFGKQAEGEKVPIAFGTEGFHRVLKLFAVLRCHRWKRACRSCSGSSLLAGSS